MYAIVIRTFDLVYNGIECTACKKGIYFSRDSKINRSEKVIGNITNIILNRIKSQPVYFIN